MFNTIKISTLCAVLKMITFSMGIIILVSIAVTCANYTVDDPRGKNMMSAKAIEEVIKEHTDELMSIPGVVGTAQGLCDGKPCIKVLIIKKNPELEQKIPNLLEGYPVVVQETGEIRALTIEEVLKEHTDELMSIPGVVGTAQGLCDGKPCIKVYVIKKTPELEQKIPDILEGYPVVAQETGEFRALPQKQNC